MGDFKKAIHQNVVFKLAVTPCEGIIVKQMGLKCFRSDDMKIVVPLGFPLDDEHIGERCTANIRDYDGMLLLELGEDDRLVPEEDKGEYLISSVDDINNLRDTLDVAKEGLANTVISLFGTLCGAIIGSFIFFKILGHAIVGKCILGMGAGFLLDIIYHIYLMGKVVIYDRVGNWINLSNGSTSLNGGSFKWQLSMSDEDGGESGTDGGEVLGNIK